MATMDLGDVTIHYEEVGQGPLALIYCESDHMTWGPKHHDARYPNGEETLIAEITHWKADFGRAIWWEYRGKGESSEPPKYTLPLVALDLSRLLDKLEIKKAVIYGLEWGGFLAQQFALEYPEQVAALILDSTGPELNAAASEGQHKSAYERLKDPVAFPERPEWSVFACRVMASLREQPFTTRLKHIKAPTLILAGAKDTTTRGPGGSVIMSRQIANSKLKIFEEGGHGILREQPKLVHDMVGEFCRERGVI